MEFFGKHSSAYLHSISRLAGLGYGQIAQRKDMYAVQHAQFASNILWIKSRELGRQVFGND